jgi:hypothetical protein
MKLELPYKHLDYWDYDYYDDLESCPGERRITFEDEDYLCLRYDFHNSQSVFYKINEIFEEEGLFYYHLYVYKDGEMVKQHRSYVKDDIMWYNRLFLKIISRNYPEFFI